MPNLKAFWSLLRHFACWNNGDIRKSIFWKKKKASMCCRVIVESKQLVTLKKKRTISCLIWCLLSFSVFVISLNCLTRTSLFKNSSCSARSAQRKIKKRPKIRPMTPKWFFSSLKRPCGQDGLFLKDDLLYHEVANQTMIIYAQFI